MKTKKRLFSILLCVVLAVVALTAMAYAAESETSANVYADVDKTSAFVGDTITVTFSTKAVQCTTLTGGISYDPTQLEFVSVQMAEANGNKLLIQNLNPDAFRMVGVEHNIVNDGKVGRVGFYSVGTERDGVEAENFAATDLFVATFKVLKTGEIKIVVREDSFQGSQNKEVQTITVTATEKPVSVLYGDVNDDGEVDMLDEMLLSQYNAKWDVALNELNADVNGDGEIDMLDEMLLSQYNAKWDVTLGPVE